MSTRIPRILLTPRLDTLQSALYITPTGTIRQGYLYDLRVRDRQTLHSPAPDTVRGARSRSHLASPLPHSPSSCIMADFLRPHSNECVPCRILPPPMNP